MFYFVSRSETLTEALDEINCGLVRDRGDPPSHKATAGLREDGLSAIAPKERRRELNTVSRRTEIA